GPVRPAPGRGSRTSRRSVLSALALALLLLVVGGVGYLLTRGGGEADDASVAGTTSGTASASPTGRGSASASPTESAGRSPTRATGSSSPSAPEATSGPAGGLAEKSAFLRSYFESAPGGTDAGWAQLGPAEKSVGRASYDRFWGAIAAADVSDVAAGDSSDTVEATIRYRYENGRVVVERQRLRLIRADGDYLIDDDEVLSSRTVSG
ncbi:MAG: hypothetical protein WB441_08085, partial [Nocardioidaceae bacterium]